MNSNLKCDLHSPRATKARLAVPFDNRPLRLLAWLLVVASLLGWIWGVFIQHQMIAHLLFAISGSLAIPLFWYYGELKELAPSRAIASATDISEVLSRRLLAKLRKGMTPQDLAKLVSKEQGGYFFGARFGVGPEFLLELSSAVADKTDIVWQN
jgi:hypothetical protein